MKTFKNFRKENKTCKVGEYYCNTDQKCKPIPSGYKVDEDGMLMKEEPRIPRKSGQPADSKKHSDLYTDENPKNTIQGLKFATEDDAEKSVKKIKNSGRSHAHKIQAAVAMEQRAKEMGKASAAAVYRNYINSMKKNEDAPVNNVGGGNIAGVGVGPAGEPGIVGQGFGKRKKKKSIVMGTLKRNIKENFDNNNVMLKQVLDGLDKVDTLIDFSNTGRVGIPGVVIGTKEPRKSFKEKYKIK
jgi:hypothetical protein